MLHDRLFASSLRQIGNTTDRGDREDVDRRPAVRGAVVL